MYTMWNHTMVLGAYSYHIMKVKFTLIFLSIMKGSVIVLLGIITLRFAGSGRDCGRGWKCLNHAHTIILLLTTTGLQLCKPCATTLVHDLQLYKSCANCGYPSLVPSSSSHPADHDQSGNLTWRTCKCKGKYMIITVCGNAHKQLQYSTINQ